MDLKEIEKVVIIKRNKEAAENFARALKQEGEIVGVLQFGAGHKDGLIKELNSQGLSVVVITPEEILNRSQGPALSS